MNICISGVPRSFENLYSAFLKEDSFWGRKKKTAQHTETNILCDCNTKDICFRNLIGNLLTSETLQNLVLSKEKRGG